MNDRLKIGISACFFHADAGRKIFTGKTLQYVEQSVAHWAMASGAVAVMIPSPEGETKSTRRPVERPKKSGAAAEMACPQPTLEVLPQ